ncbi:MAG: ABC transporter substrate-binding protein [Desulfobacteraceae bacterium]|nr:ABC transporter substrate-binding protein [Desulfobacteraceae bacterium]
MRRFILNVKLIAAVLMTFAMVVPSVSKASAEAPGAQPAVKAVLDRAMEIQTKPELQGDANRKDRARLIRQLISESFLAEEMARESIAENWDKLSAKQRSEFSSVFKDLFQDSYTRMVLNFMQKETIEYKGESPSSGGVQVRTVIMRAAEHIPVDYKMERKNNNWFIRDVDIDGVSIVGAYKDKFRVVIKKDSFDGLMKSMKLQKQASGAE